MPSTEEIAEADQDLWRAVLESTIARFQRRVDLPRGLARSVHLQDVRGDVFFVTIDDSVAPMVSSSLEEALRQGLLKQGRDLRVVALRGDRRATLQIIDPSSAKIQARSADAPSEGATGWLGAIVARAMGLGELVELRGRVAQLEAAVAELRRDQSQSEATITLLGKWVDSSAERQQAQLEAAQVVADREQEAKRAAVGTLEAFGENAEYETAVLVEFAAGAKKIEEQVARMEVAVARLDAVLGES